MLDKLLGRAELKDRIEELESDKHHLERQLEAEQERRADAVADKQAAEERVNHLEDRIEELEDRVERLSGDEAEAELDFRQVSDATGARTADLLDRLRGVDAGQEGALTASVPNADALPAAVTDLFGDHAALVRRAAPAVVVADDASLVAAALRPPIAPDEEFCEWDTEFHLDDAWFRPVGRVGFALVRSDLFAVGTYEDGDRVDFEGFGSDVMGAHSKGGFSQDRFERRRDEQIDEHLVEVREVLDRVAGDTDRLVVVGEKSILGEVSDVADVTDVSDATGDPEPALEDAFERFWTTRVYGI
ncbi:Vms1/Ankzf1 family peptidyl-tRNA hydrolase [Haloparvum sp. PAK95]|uniref:Vms1/Ankzf1 family peptidyl-tRNA hydrolase n=1 Tax=Haloparvum sp. PAK95 TaxID=3418962 RepID=UPI003D2EA2B8